MLDNGEDLLHVLAAEHRALPPQVEALGHVVGRLDSRQRRSRLRDLTLGIAVHLEVEALAVHPLAAQVCHGGDAYIRPRRDDIDAIRQALHAAGDSRDDADRIVRHVETLHGAMLAHENGEELEVFPYARRATTKEDLQQAGRWYRVAVKDVIDRYRATRRSTAGGTELDPEPWDDRALGDTLRTWLAQGLSETDWPGANSVAVDEAVPADEPHVDDRNRYA